jgi:hypothetical protein
MPHRDSREDLLTAYDRWLVERGDDLPGSRGDRVVLFLEWWDRGRRARRPSLDLVTVVLDDKGPDDNPELRRPHPGVVR